MSESVTKIRNEFFCDKYTLCEDKPQAFKLPWKVLTSNQIFTEKPVFVHVMDIQCEQNSSPSVEPTFVMEGLLTVYESFRESETRFVRVTEPFECSLQDQMLAFRSDAALSELLHQLLQGIKNLALLKCDYLNLSPEYIVRTQDLRGNKTYKLAVYGQPFRAMKLEDKYANGSQSQIVRATDAFYSLGCLAYHIVYGFPYSSGKQFPASAQVSQETVDLVQRLIVSPQISFDEFNTIMQKAHKQKMAQLISGGTIEPTVIPKGFTGKMRQIASNGNIYEGEFLEGLKHGEGTLTFRQGSVYKGEWKQGVMNGKCRYSFHDGAEYQGSVVDGLFEGFGVYTFSNKDRYEGEFFQDRFHGEGVLTYHTGYSLRGEFRRDNLGAKGELRRGQQLLYSGEFKHGLYSGSGSKWYENGDRFEGKWEAGCKWGAGVYRHSDGTVYRGGYREGKKHGNECELLHSNRAR